MEALFRNMLRGLELAGRDWRRIDRCLWEWERELDGLAGLQAWAGDYREFLLGKYGEVLDRLILDAVAREEFERAEACLQRKKRLFPEESL